VIYEAIQRQLDAGEVVIIDGGTGTELERRGVAMNPEAWCGAATVNNQDVLEAIHVDYIKAGAQVLTANTYASSRLMLKPAGLEDNFYELNRTAIEVANRAREGGGAANVAIAGSISHMVPMIPGDSQVDRSRNPSTDEMEHAFGELASLHKTEGADLIIMEMMFHPERMPLALKAATDSGLPVWAGLSARRGDDGSVLSFTQEADIPFAEIVEIAAGFDIAAIGVMHTPSNITGDAIDITSLHCDKPLMAYPDSGYFAMPEWRFENIIPPAELCRFANDWKAKGVQILGGCCGLSPKHISALSQMA